MNPEIRMAAHILRRAAASQMHPWTVRGIVLFGNNFDPMTGRCLTCGAEPEEECGADPGTCKRWDYQRSPEPPAFTACIGDLMEFRP